MLLEEEEKRRKKSNNNNNKKKKIRFSDEQIQSLEMMFESETKLEGRKKVELAKELGLQPRQVAIWFQNKRARWKSKQIEKDYNLLLSNYNNLAAQFDSLKKDNQSLLIQLQKLKNNEMVGTIECKNQETGGAGSDGECYKKKIGDFKLLGMDDEEEEEEDELLIKMVDVDNPNPSPLTITTSHEEDWGSSTLDDDTAHNYLSWDFWS
ncbi:hypothetical protein ACJIZ3_007561 [Penstemon smallii]|uniref:Homeobox-leucine zipper protein n=1 Tax=Penstemon smallii TaxID=265156 RepID=A0ABD3T8D2_9LAMI